MTKFGRSLRYFALFALPSFFISDGSLWAKFEPRLEDGLAITQPHILETLSHRSSGQGIGIGYYLDPTGQSPPVISNRELAKLPLMQVILKSIRQELQDYTATS